MAFSSSRASVAGGPGRARRRRRPRPAPPPRDERSIRRRRPARDRRVGALVSDRGERVRWRRAATRPRSSATLPEPAPRPPQWAISLAAFVFGLWVGGGLLSGWLFVRTVDALLRGVRPPPPPVVLVREVTVTVPDPRAAPVRPPPTATPTAALARPTATATPETEEPLPTWDGTDRVTILLLGIDQRPEEKAARTPARSDTMILVTLDPLNLTAAMLSLPRDLFVPIRGHGEDKLNTAHFWGDYDHYGSGPELARRTIQYNFGVPVHFVARVDFDGFVKLIDAVGGITVDVERAILDDEYPDEEYGVTRL